MPNPGSSAAENLASTGRSAVSRSRVSQRSFTTRALGMSRLTSDTRAFFHVMSTTNPPLARRPETWPSGHAVGKAGNKSTVPSWLWSSISAMAAVAPKFPSIWNQPGGWRSKRPLDTWCLRNSRRCVQARCPSSSLAHNATTHARLQPDAPPPFANRCSRERRVAAASAGADLGVTSLPG